MRKNLEVVSILALVAMAWMTMQAISGPHQLPQRIATHFDWSTGEANGWGSPSAFLFLPVVAVGLWLLLTAVARFPSAFNYPVRVTVRNREILERIALDMMAWLKMELVVLFAGLHWMTISLARAGNARGAMVHLLPMLGIGVVFTTIGIHIARMVRAR